MIIQCLDCHPEWLPEQTRKPSGRWRSCQPAPERGGRRLLCPGRAGLFTEFADKIRIGFRLGYRIQKAPVPSSFLKREGGNRMLVLLYILCLVFLLPSCRIRRSGTREEYAFRADSLVVSGKDSSLLTRKTFTVDSINWNITRVVFSPPDSTGRQYPAEITLLQGSKHHNMIDTVSHTDNSLLEITHQQTNQSSFSENKEYNQSSSIRIWIISGILFAGGYIGWNIIFPRNFNK